MSVPYGNSGKDAILSVMWHIVIAGEMPQCVCAIW